MIAKLPQLIEAVGSSVRTNYPVDKVADLLTIAGQVSDETTTKKVLGPPYALHPPTNTTGGIYTLKIDFDRLARLSIELFGANSRYSDEASAPTPSASPAAP